MKSTYAPFDTSSSTDSEAYRATGIACLLLLALPFTQFGYGYWTSVQGFMFLMVVFSVRKDIGRLEFLLFTVISLTMLLSLIGHLYADTLFYSFVRLVRQIISMYLIVCAASMVSWRPKPFFFSRLIPAVVLGLSALIVLQFVTYTVFGMSTFFVPSSFFFGGFSTLADRWLEFGARHGFLADVRASGPYSEPSYFGFVALSLAMLIVRGVTGAAHRALLLGALLIALVCSKSASGVPLFVLLVLFAYRDKLNIVHWFGIVLMALGLLVISETVLNFHLIDRLSNIADPVREPSGYVRLILPLKHIALVLEHKPLGVPMSEFFTFASRHVEAYPATGGFNPITLTAGVAAGTDNGFLNFFLTQGYGGFVILGLLPFVVRDKLVLVFLLFVSQFNGDILSPDKAAIIALAISTRPKSAAGVTNEADAAKRFTPPNSFGAMFPARG